MENNANISLFQLIQLLPEHLKKDTRLFVEFLLQKEKIAKQDAAPTPISLKRGAGKQFISFVAEDFNATPEEFNEYM